MTCAVVDVAVVVVLVIVEVVVDVDIKVGGGVHCLFRGAMKSSRQDWPLICLMLLGRFPGFSRPGRAGGGLAGAFPRTEQESVVMAIVEMRPRSWSMWRAVRTLLPGRLTLMLPFL